MAGPEKPQSSEMKALAEKAAADGLPLTAQGDKTVNYTPNMLTNVVPSYDSINQTVENTLGAAAQINYRNTEERLRGVMFRPTEDLTLSIPIGAALGSMAGYGSVVAVDGLFGPAGGLGLTDAVNKMASTAVKAAPRAAVYAGVALAVAEVAYYADAQNEITARQRYCESQFKASQEFKNIRGMESSIRGKVGKDGLLKAGFTLTVDGQIDFTNAANVPLMEKALEDEKTRLTGIMNHETGNISRWDTYKIWKDKTTDVYKCAKRDQVVVDSALKELPYYAEKVQLTDKTLQEAAVRERQKPASADVGAAEHDGTAPATARTNVNAPDAAKLKTR